MLKKIRQSTYSALFTAVFSALSLLLTLYSPAQAQTDNSKTSSWPNKAIRMVIGFAAGGPTDMVSRVIAQKLSEHLGQQVFIDNKPGAGGSIAAEIVARAPADGYTLFYNTSAVVIAPALYTKVNFDPLKDFEPVLLTASVPLVFVVNPGLPALTVAQFIALAKSRPDQLNYSSSGSGTITHLVPTMFLKQSNLQAQHVPYKGSAPGLLDVAAGQTQFMIDTINTVLPYVKDGKIRALAVTSAKRTSVLPDTPTLVELGFPGFEASAWQGIMAPAGTSPAIVAKLNEVTNRVLRDPEVIKTLAAQGAETLGGSVADYAAYLRTEIPRWAQAVKDSGAKEN
jgi:tripartite-type tricarboxylate transporter receptor subunit TctC